MRKLQRAITEMYPRIPLELLADPLGTKEHTWEPLV
jgi:hypothetical protein